MRQTLTHFLIIFLGFISLELGLLQRKLFFWSWRDFFSHAFLITIIRNRFEFLYPQSFLLSSTRFTSGINALLASSFTLVSAICQWLQLSFRKTTNFDYAFKFRPPYVTSGLHSLSLPNPSAIVYKIPVQYTVLSVTLYSPTMNLDQADNKLILSPCFSRMLHSLQGKLYTLHSTLSDILHIWFIFDKTVDSYSFDLPRHFFLDCTDFFFIPATYSFSIVHDNTSVQCTLLYLFYTLSLIKLFRGCFSSLPISERIHHRALSSSRKTLHSTIYSLLMSFLSYIRIWTLAKITLRQLLFPTNRWVQVFSGYNR